MTVTFVEQTPFTSGLSKAGIKACKASVASARSERNALLAKLSVAVAHGDDHQARSLQKEALASEGMRLCAVLDAAKKLVPREKRPSLEACLAKASSLTFEKPLSEAVYAYPKPKSSGGVRMIYLSGIARRAQHEMVRFALSPYVKPRRFQFEHMGLHAAVAAAKLALAGGMVCGARLDIVSFHESFDHTAMCDTLPLPKELIENVVSSRRMKPVLMKPYSHMALSQHQLLQQARRGVPQGASCSPMVASFCVSRLAWTPKPGVVLLNYVDDFLLLASSKGELEEAIVGLTKAIEDLPGGTFQLKPALLSHAAKGIDFLGHRLVADVAGIRAEIAHGCLKNFFKRLDDLDGQLNESGFLLLAPSAGKVKHARLLALKLGFVRSWGAAFSQAEHVGDYVAPIVNEIETLAAWLELTLHDLQKHDGFAEAYDRYLYTAA